MSVYRRLFALLLVSLLTGAYISYSDAVQEKKETEAVAAALKWLALVDAMKYAGSWKESSELFKKTLTQEQWTQAMEAGRKPFGALVSRKLKNRKYFTVLPGVPKGEYMVIQFDASFANRDSVVETVTPLLEKDGKWRVSGYYIK